MKSLIKYLYADESGVVAIEYALLGGLIAVVILAGVSSVGSQLNSMFTLVKDRVVLALQ